MSPALGGCTGRVDGGLEALQVGLEPRLTYLLQGALHLGVEDFADGCRDSLRRGISQSSCTPPLTLPAPLMRSTAANNLTLMGGPPPGSSSTAWARRAAARNTERAGVSAAGSLVVGNPINRDNPVVFERTVPSRIGSDDGPVRRGAALEPHSAAGPRRQQPPVGIGTSQSLAPRSRVLNSQTCDIMTDVVNGVAIRPKESWDKAGLRRAMG